MPAGGTDDTVSTALHDANRDLLQKRAHHTFVEEPIDEGAPLQEIDHLQKKTTDQTDATRRVVEHGQIRRKGPEPTTKQGECLAGDVVATSECCGCNGNGLVKGRVTVAYSAQCDIEAIQAWSRKHRFVGHVTVSLRQLRQHLLFDTDSRSQLDLTSLGRHYTRRLPGKPYGSTKPRYPGQG